MRTTLKILLTVGAMLIIAHACRKPKMEPATLLKESISAEFVVAKQHLYTLMQNKVKVYDVTNEAQPAYITEFSVNVGKLEQAEKITSEGNFLFIIASSGAYVYDISTPSKPSFFSRIDQVSSCASFAIKDTLVYFITDTCNEYSRTFYVKTIEEGGYQRQIYQERLDLAGHISLKGSLVFISLGADGISFRLPDTAYNFNQIRHDQTVQADATLPMKDNNVMIINNEGFHQYSYDTSFQINHLSTIAITH